ncbi:MAG: helix-turn-helix transcriptional regulator [Clostridia bacterium]|nr:helix-turn-helix transcriptional regulator [Clostridia bacterium]
MVYTPITLDSEVEIKQIVAVHYFEYSRDFIFSGEMHDFWEVVYSDKDWLSVTVRSKEELIPPGHFRLISPMEFHSVKPVAGKSANAVIFSFICENEKLTKTAGQTIKCDDEKKEYISKLIAAAHEAFSTPLGEPYSTRLVKNPNASLGAQNLVKIYLELFLLSCIRESAFRPAKSAPLTHITEPFLSEVCSYLEANVCSDIKFGDLCKRFGISSSNMKKLFHDHIGMGAMEYFSRCKINCAKHLIREKEMNFSQISEYLGFSSLQYFSKRFKSIVSMTPSEYMISVRDNKL